MEIFGPRPAPRVNARDVVSRSGSALPTNVLPTGSVVQVVNTQTGAVATGTTTMPSDDTIPQNTEGDEYMTLAITPKNAANTLMIQVVCMVSPSAAGAHVMQAALFQDTTANALASITERSSQSENTILTFTHKMTAGTVSETTFKVRAASNAAGTTTFNGSTSARIHGGVIASSITIMEIAA